MSRGNLHERAPAVLGGEDTALASDFNPDARGRLCPCIDLRVGRPSCQLYPPHFSPTRLYVLIQFVSQVVPPSAEKACSARTSLDETGQMEKRTRMLRPR